MKKDAEKLLSHFGHHYRESVGEIYPPSWGRDVKMFTGLLNAYSYEQLENLLTRYFGVKRKIYSIPFFKVALSELLQEEKRLNPPLPDKMEDNENWRFE